MGPIRASTVLPAAVRRSSCTPPTGCALVGRAGAARGPRPGGDAGHPAPAAHARRLHGQPRAAQGVLPAAGARRPRRAAVQHPRDVVAGGHERGRLRRRGGRAVRRGGRDRVRRVPRGPRAAAAAGCSAGRSAPTWRSMHGLRPVGRGRDPALAAAALRRATSTSTPGPQSGKPVLALVPELDDYLRPAEARERFARIPQAEVVGVDGAKHLWVGEPAVRRVLDEIVERVAPDSSPAAGGVLVPAGDAASATRRAADDRGGPARPRGRSRACPSCCCTPSRCRRRCGSSSATTSPTSCRVDHARPARVRRLAARLRRAVAGPRWPTTWPRCSTASS